MTIFCKKKIITNFKIKIMALINPHINFNGNAEEAFNFYKSVFGGEWMIDFDPNYKGKIH
jgi:hypothetical protein